MRVFRLVLALALGVSTIATAQPQESRDRHGDRDRGHDRDREHDRASEWITLSGSVPATQNRHVIKVYASAGRFEKVRITIDTGRVYVKQIAIEVGTKNWQRYRFNKWVRAGQAIEVALPDGAREISRIVVQTQPQVWRTHATFSVLGLRAATRSRHDHDRGDYDDRYDRYEKFDR